MPVYYIVELLCCLQGVADGKIISSSNVATWSGGCVCSRYVQHRDTNLNQSFKCACFTHLIMYFVFAKVRLQLNVVEWRWSFFTVVRKLVLCSVFTAHCGAGAPLFPPCPFTSSSFPLFPHWLYLFSSFVHPFPFYQNSPTPFPGRRS